jgi:hypothetical protein
MRAVAVGALARHAGSDQLVGLVADMREPEELVPAVREATGPELAVPDTHGKTQRVVRTIWEGCAGWFRVESTTGVCGVPATAADAAIAGLAGVGALAAQCCRPYPSGSAPRSATARRHLEYLKAPDALGHSATKLLQPAQD